MGVQGLWELLAPVGRRVSVETLAGKRVAIDASIWIVQFMKAMRDEKGEMVRNAHLLGFFRRICKLLYLRTKPVFVFDGGTPALKRRTVMARRRQRENAQAKVRKTAEKLLLNQLKAMRLKELAEDLENQRRKQKNDAKGAKLLSESAESKQRSEMGSSSLDAEKLDEMLAASIAAENCGSSANNASIAAAVAPSEEEHAGEDEEMILKNDAKGKKILSDERDQVDRVWSNVKGNNVASMNYDQHKLDEMLAASIAAEEDGGLTGNASTSGPAIPSEEDDGDDDEEMLLPMMHGNIDPAVLAALPPSMQLDLLVQMRERLMAENRQKYQKVKKAPGKFSELQIQAYLKTVAFRREIDEVQKAAAGRGVGGVQTSRIASEANREFIFSSSFSGDKQVLTVARGEANGEKQQNTPAEQPNSDSMNRSVFISKSNDDMGFGSNESRRMPNDDVETYVDERGRVRVSRLRAMGIRMTRDLQRNLDLMKENDHGRTTSNNIANVESLTNQEETGTGVYLSSQNQLVETSQDGNGESINLNEGNEHTVLKDGTSIEISFEYDGGNKNIDDDDDVFAHLVAGVPMNISCTDVTPKKQFSDSASDTEWEEVPIGGKGHSSVNDDSSDIKPSLRDRDISDESEVEWEETPCDAIKNSEACPAESGKPVSRGYLEEEADLQEAIRRSLLDVGGKKSNYMVSKLKHSKELTDFLNEENDTVGPNMLGEQNKSSNDIVGGVEEIDTAGREHVLKSIDSSERPLKSSVVHSSRNMGVLINKSCEKYPAVDSEQSGEEKGNLNREMLCAESVTLPNAKEVDFLPEQHSDDSMDVGGLTTLSDNSRDCSHSFDVVATDLPDILNQKESDSQAEPSVLVGDKKNNIEAKSSILINDNDFEPETLCHSTEKADPSDLMVESSGKESTYDADERKLAAESSHEKPSQWENNMENSAIEVNENVQVEFTEASLEEEMLFLDREFMNLGNEQKRLERNAESVTSEMFAECQELLQMFGLPYIIAPMEAEAQCAHMELANLVDGVVTDDSDVFLFGARSVYKNIFDDRKYVETYFMKDIEKELGLTREKLIHMALLLGSDYTEGVSGIGIVNAIEVVNAFPEEDGLLKFREWIESPDPSILGKLNVQKGSNTRKSGPKVGKNGLKSSAEEVLALDQNVTQADESQQSVDDIQEMKQIFMDKHRNVSKNWHIPSSFPSEAVTSAYSCPQVDTSTEPFRWGKPDLFVLRKLCWEKFGWTSLKTDELLLPVLKEYEKRETQLRLEAFYSFNERFAKIRSKRINRAVKGITGKQSLELMDDAVPEGSKTRKRGRVSPVASRDDKVEKPLMKGGKSVEEKKSMEKLAPKRSRKKGGPGKLVSSESGNLEPPLQVVSKQNSYKGSHGNRGGQKRKGSLDFELTETSSTYSTSGNDDRQTVNGNLEQAQEMRRSTRSRKPVNYNVDDLEVDKADEFPSDKECPNEEAGDQDFSGAQDICGGAAVGPSGKEQEAVNPPVEEGSSGDYLQMGGGFCMNEDDVSQPFVSQNGDSYFQDEFPSDYLAMGGGFCVNGDETNKDQNAADNRAIGENARSSDFSFTDEVEYNVGSGESISGLQGDLYGKQNGRKTFDTKLNLDDQTTSTRDDHSSLGVPVQDTIKNDNGTASVSTLSAMPFLKRKRRKS